MSLYAISLFLHIVGALALCAVLGLEWAGLVHLRRATRIAQAREWIRLLAAPGRLAGPAALLILLTGAYMTATRWGPRAWILVGLAGMVVIAALGAAMTGRRVRGITRTLPPEDGPIPAPLGRQLLDPLLGLSLRLRIALLIGVVFLMSTQPGTAGSLVAMSLAALGGLAAGLPVGRAAQARMAGSER